MEVYGLSDVIRKILLFNRATLLSSVAANILEEFFKAIGTFSCQVIHQSAIEESVSNTYIHIKINIYKKSACLYYNYYEIAAMCCRR
jgi:hypothetical protein